MGCYVQCSDGDNFGGPRVHLPPLQPGQGTYVVVEMNSPPIPGIYQSKWRACTPTGSYFGGMFSLTYNLQHILFILVIIN